MTKIKTLGATALLFAAAAAPAFAQDGRVLGSRYGWEPSSSVNSEMPGTHSVRRNSETTEPGDFAVTGGESDTSRAWNPTDQVAPGTSNAPCGNCGGE
jgi:hypothetical protein